MVWFLISVVHVLTDIKKFGDFRCISITTLLTRCLSSTLLLLYEPGQTLVLRWLRIVPFHWNLLYGPLGRRLVDVIVDVGWPSEMHLAHVIDVVHSSTNRSSLRQLHSIYVLNKFMPGGFEVNISSSSTTTSGAFNFLSVTDFIITNTLVNLFSTILSIQHKMPVHHNQTCFHKWYFRCIYFEKFQAYVMNSKTLDNQAELKDKDDGRPDTRPADALSSSSTTPLPWIVAEHGHGNFCTTLRKMPWM